MLSNPAAAPAPKPPTPAANVKTPPNAAGAKNPAEGRPPTPAGDDFWKRYSPHHEFPLSTAASLVLHMLIVLLVALFGSFLFSYDSAPPPTMDAVVFAGGGGDPSGNSLDRDAISVGPEAIEFDPNATRRPENVLPTIPELNSPAQPRMVEDAAKRSSEIVKRAKGMGGSGTGDGLGRGHGTGIGDGEGPGKGGKRNARTERWDVRFTYQTGDDYLRQLRSLGVFLAFRSGTEGRYFLFKELVTSAKPQMVGGEGLSKLNRIYWLNNDPQAAGEVGRTLGVSPQPDSFWAFFPVEFEQDLLKQETAERTKKGKKEEDIKATVFKVQIQGGIYKARLTEVTYFK